MIGIGRRVFTTVIATTEAVSGGTAEMPVQEPIPEEPEIVIESQIENESEKSELETKIEDAIENHSGITISNNENANVVSDIEQNSEKTDTTQEEIPEVKTTVEVTEVTEVTEETPPITQDISKTNAPEKPTTDSENKINIGKPKAVSESNTTTTNDVSASSVKSEESNAEIIGDMKTKYPTGSEWTKDTYYECKGSGVYSGGYGCAGFAYMLSDSIYKDAKMSKTANLKKLEIYDIVELDKGKHTAFVIAINNDTKTITVAEGSIGDKVVWGTEYPMTDIYRIIKRE